MKRSKKSKQKVYTDLEVYPDTSDEEVDLRPRKTFHYHTTAFVSSTGTQTITSAVAGPPSPGRSGSPLPATHGPYDREKESLPANSDVDVLQQFDFLQDGFFEAWNAEYESGPKRRVRTGAVRVVF